MFFLEMNFQIFFIIANSITNLTNYSFVGFIRFIDDLSYLIDLPRDITFKIKHMCDMAISLYKVILNYLFIFYKVNVYIISTRK
jgi:hypothetical protein